MINSDYAQYSSLGKTLVQDMEPEYKTPEVTECIDHIVTEVLTEQEEKLKEIQDIIFKPVVVENIVPPKKRERLDEK